MEAAEIYRQYAANCLKLAKKIKDVNEKAHLLEVALAWSRVAERCDTIRERTAAVPLTAARKPPARQEVPRKKQRN